METENVDRIVARRSAAIYVPLSLAAGALFYLAASATGEPSLVARIGGATWVTLLSLIVSMPIVISRVKRAMRR